MVIAQLSKIWNKFDQKAYADLDVAIDFLIDHQDHACPDVLRLLKIVRKVYSGQAGWKYRNESTLDKEYVFDKQLTTIVGDVIDTKTYVAKLINHKGGENSSYWYLEMTAYNGHAPMFSYSVGNISSIDPFHKLSSQWYFTTKLQREVLWPALLARFLPEDI